MIEPRWVSLARADLGLREAPGVANNPLIMSRLQSINKLLGMVYNSDSVPWCGAMMAWWMNQCKITPPAIAARAKSWATWGDDNRAYPCIGSVLYMERLGGGHVTLLVGANASYYFGLGANQGDSVSIAAFTKDRVKAIRWPKGEPLFHTQLPTNIASARVGVSEA